MSERTFDAFVRTETEAEWAARSERLSAQLAKTAAAYDRRGAFPFEHFEALRREGFLRLTVPRRYGGEELSLYALLLVIERIARGDGSTALGLGWHLGLMLHYRESGRWPEPLLAWFARQVVEHGAMINHFATEPKTGSPSRGGLPETRAVRVPGGYRLTGRKTFSTLAPIVRHFVVTAIIEGNADGASQSPNVASPKRPEAGEANAEAAAYARAAEARLAEFLVEKGPGVRIEETWDTLGMRATGSHDVVLEEVFVPDARFIGYRDKVDSSGKREDGDGWQLFIPAVYLGIAQAARDFAVRYAVDYRPNSLGGRSIADLPHVQTKIGEIERDLLTARTLVYSVAERWDRDAARRAALSLDIGVAKSVATNVAIDVVDRAMRIVGGASLARSLPLERLYRDVRAGLHNPPMDDVVIQRLAERAIAESTKHAFD
ncbi:MAG: acyl-CoA/acyl-ACP dehydrogenase [Hydrogenibacillus sp.]|nr:acyl-CoA/acyl-ACP dehydrogenase [Hydrogenibacillus sp.]